MTQSYGTPEERDERESIATVHRAIELGVTLLDTAEAYGPYKNEELLAQMSQIGQLQASTDLQSSLKTVTLQNSLGSAGNLIGKMVTGQDSNGKPLSGLVNSVKVVDGAVSLELDNGQTVSLSNVTGITAMPATAAK